MSTEEINQPVVAYFTFIQNNMAQITSGNATQVMREAEQRHLQIMHQVIGQLREEWTSRLAMREQEFEQRLQEAESGSLVAKAEYQKLSSEAVQALENAKASHQAEGVPYKSLQVKFLTSLGPELLLRRQQQLWPMVQEGAAVVDRQRRNPPEEESSFARPQQQLPPMEVDSNSPPPIFRDVRKFKDVHFLIQKPLPEEAYF
eukprot:s2789_g1.t1